MSLVQIEKPKIEEKVQKQLRKASDVFLHATEKQCSYFLSKEGEKGREYCAIGLMGLYSGNEPNILCTDDQGRKTYGFNMLSTEFSDAFSFFGMDQNRVFDCPDCGKQDTLSRLIPHLNNKSRLQINEMNFNEGAHGKSFKEIGQWLQKIGY